MHAPAPNAAVIALENVHKRFGSFVAVHSASFEIRRSEFFSILGPSGCGKTTLLRLIAGFEEPTSGSIRLDGTDVSGVPPYRRCVNTVFQQYALFPHLDVFDNVAFGPRTAGVPEQQARQRVGEMLEIVRLAGLANRRPEQLSGGERQRVALARALVNSPKALLLDEPLSALDLELRRAMQGELKRIQREVGIAFVFVTHDQEEALALSDRTAVLRGGRIEQIGTPEDIYRRPDSAFVAGFIGAANLLRARVIRLRGGEAEVELASGHRTQVPARDGEVAAEADALVMIRPERVKLHHEAPPADGWSRVFPVTVRDVTFQGPVLRCLLRSDDGEELTASVDDSLRPYGLVAGARMWAEWNPADAHLLDAKDRDA